MDDISYFGLTNHRQNFVPFGIRQVDRLMHTYAIGATGAGKSTLLETLARGDVNAGRGFAVIDPHGDLAERMRDVAGRSGRPYIYMDAASPSQPYGFNPLKRVRGDKIPLAVSGLMDAMKNLWGDAWGVRMEHVLRNSLYALIERDGSVLPDILRLYAEKAFRKEVVRRIRNPVVKAYWLHEFEKYPYRQRAEVTAPVLNKLGGLLTDPRLYHTLAEPDTPISFRKLMDEGGILIANLAKGRLGADSADTLGSMIVATISMAAFSRAEEPASNRRPFFLYVDEFQSFTTLAFATMLPELRKMGVGLVLSHQHLHQLSPDIRHAVLGNVGTLVAFRVGAEDAPVIARELQPDIGELDLLNLPNHRFYTKLMIDGTPSKVFSACSFNIMESRSENSITSRPRLEETTIRIV
ncbi:type IV secretory system conjugative DNA transfer family protein [Novosphingobium naphthalenivorans]|uniref:type IV secretory system conjugative DNA transfer family protein n=1 Tax=Novosphingobium naphthalenivorans TaxID=273168 RepID=UPI00082D8797|nr:type IV secretion system DNA-binding domain-containing protein [Novosphingobium naphthalenivorans]